MKALQTITTLGFLSAAALTIAPEAQAASFGTDGISFDEDTTLSISYELSVGKFVSNLFIGEVGTEQEKNDWTHLFGETPGAKTTFDFKAGISYFFALDSGSNGVVFSTSSLNEGSQQAIFADSLEFDASDETVLFAGFEGLIGGEFDGSATIGFDDGGNGDDKDFQDFVFSVSTEVPEPASVIGLMAIGASALTLRRRTRA
jgi:hypothetical protein